MTVFMVLGAIIAVVLLSNVRVLLLCALLGGAGFFYYQQQGTDEQERLHTMAHDYERRLQRAWQSFWEE